VPVGTIFACNCKTPADRLTMSRASGHAAGVCLGRRAVQVLQRATTSDPDPHEGEDRR